MTLHRAKLIDDLEKLSKTHKFKVIAISGWSQKILSDFQSRPWLKKVKGFRHKTHETMYVFETE